jgi:hypothetical protein
MPADGEQTVVYKGRTIKLIDPGEDVEAVPMLSIDDTDIMVQREETGGFSAPMWSMYGVFGSLEELAVHLINSSPAFMSQPPAKPAN